MECMNVIDNYCNDLINLIKNEKEHSETLIWVSLFSPSISFPFGSSCFNQHLKGNLGNYLGDCTAWL